jgi:DNA mismatch endonuclease (patch repair protein)
MRSIRQEDTAPEVAVRRHLHAAGLRFRLHPADLPGRPDIVARKRRTAIFVHGCFWHGHDCAHGRVAAKSNAEYWAAKIEANRQRDRRKAHQLRQLGWIVETIWECQCNSPKVLAALTRRLLAR